MNEWPKMYHPLVQVLLFVWASHVQVAVVSSRSGIRISVPSLSTSSSDKSSSSHHHDGDSDHDGDLLESLLAQCESEHAALLAETNAAEARGVQVYLERSTLEVASYFASVARADNSTWAQGLILKHYASYYNEVPLEYAKTLVTNLPIKEANQTLETLRRARKILSEATTSSRPPLPSRKGPTTTICNGYVCNLDGTPIFGVGFNVWSSNGYPPFDPVAAGITINTVGYSAKYMLENLTYAADAVNNTRAKLDSASKANQTIHILMGQAMPDWAETRWPGLNTGNFTEHGFSYDIDNPGAAIVTSQAIQAFHKTYGCHPTFGGWILANEPSFRQSATNYTMAKYRSWLQNQYKTVLNLNSAWNSTYASFNAVSSQPTDPNWRVEMLTGGTAAEWWDWNVFNNFRVADFFGKIALDLDEVYKDDPGRCKIKTIKLQDGNEFNGHAGYGTNRTALVAVQSLNGNDMSLSPTATALGPNGKPYMSSDARLLHSYEWSRYIADWLSLGAGYILQRSVDWTKPVYNTEWHGAGTLSWRDEDMTPEYIACAVWTGIFFGEAVNVAWYFPRDGLAPDPPQNFNDSFAGSFATQPRATAEFLRSFLVASAYSDIAAGLIRQPPKVWILRSWSSFALNHNSTVALLECFEILSFLPYPVGFVFENNVSKVGESDVVIVPETSHVEDLTVTWLSHRVSKSETGKARVVLMRDANSNPLPLQFSPSGVERSKADLTFLESVPSVTIDTAEQALANLLKLPSFNDLDPGPVQCTCASNALPPFGVLCRIGVVHGRIRGLLINLNMNDTCVSFRTQVESDRSRSGEALNLVNGNVRTVLTNGACLSLYSGSVILLDFGDLSSFSKSTESSFSKSTKLNGLTPKRQSRWWFQTHTPAFTQQAVELAKSHRSSITGVYMYNGLAIQANGSFTSPSDNEIQSKVSPFHELGLTVGVALSLDQTALLGGNAEHGVKDAADTAVRNNLTSLMVDYEPKTEINQEHAEAYAHFLAVLAIELHTHNVQLDMCVSDWSILTDFGLYAKSGVDSMMSMASTYYGKNISENEKWVTAEMNEGVSMSQLRVGVGSTNSIYQKWDYNWNESDFRAFVEWLDAHGVQNLDLWRTDIDSVNATNGTEYWVYDAISKFLEAA